jgi:hypothetical protein
MEQQNMDQVNQVAETKKRPKFLTVLCILSFVGIGFAIISSIINLINFQSNIETLQSLQGTSSLLGEELGNTIDALVEWGRTIYLINLISAFICLAGVFMMFKLKKTGYFIYIIGEIAPAIASFALMGGFGPLGPFAMIMGLIFPIAFIIMYGLNLKHMS